MKSVLIIEDDKILRDMYRDKFTVSNFEVTTAENGAEGIKKALELKPDLMLLDIAMPKMDGTTLMEKLRGDSWGKNVPIIILTNLNIDGNLLDKVIKNHPAYCLMKVGVTPIEVLDKAKELLKI
jgi:CheY-like chemotaxis protein